MNTKLFVGNLSFKLAEPELEELFAQYGTVVSCSIPTDRDSGRKRGFAFIEMSSQAEAEAAIKGLNGRDVDGRQLAVSVSQPKQKDSRGGGGGGRGRY
ncbi:MAG TPA: RNA-binding protein [Candidatus Obscuribacterales bacterium]